jgi:hypothetical protein
MQPGWARLPLMLAIMSFDGGMLLATVGLNLA